MKIGLRLALGFATLVVFMIVLIILSITSLDKINTSIENLVNDKFPKTVQCNDIIDNYNIIARGNRNINLLPDDESGKQLIQAEVDRINEAQKFIDKKIDSLNQTVQSPEGRKNFDDFLAAKKVYDPLRDSVVFYGVSDREDEAKKLLFGDLRIAQGRLFETVGKMIQHQNDAVVEIGKIANEDNHSAVLWMAIIGGFAILIAIILTIWIIRSITKPVAQASTAANAIAEGNMSVNLESNSKDEIGLLLGSMKMMSGNINGLITELNSVADAAVAGKLDKRANESAFHGEYKTIMKGFNATLDAVIGPLNVTAEYVDRISKGDIPPKITDVYNGDFNEIKNNLNQCIDSVDLLVSDAKMLAKAAVEGKLDTRANASKHNGDFRVVVQGVNDTLDNVIGPLNVAAEYVDRIAKGDIPPKITDNYNGDFNEIKNNLNQAIDSVNNLVKDAKMLAKAGVEGKLDTRADASKHNGEFRAIVQGVNDTLDAVIGPLNVAAEYVDRIAKGDIPPKITDNYNGDFNEIKNNLNQAIDSVNALVRDAKMLAKAGVEGKLDTRADATKHNGEFRAIVQGVNDTLDAVIGPLNVAAEYVDKISKGDIPELITKEYNGDFNLIKNNLNTCINAVNALVADAAMLAKAAVDGKLDTRADASKHQGDFKAIVQGVNNTLDNVIGPLNVAAEYVDRIAKGDIPPKITDNYNGDFNEIKNNLNQAIDSVNALVADAVMLAKAGVEGRLATRADASKHNGDFRRIVQGVNETLDAVIGPLNVAADYVDKISKGDIPELITKEYNGDFNLIKNNLNTCIKAVNALVGDAAMLAKAAVDGKLDTRADASKHQGDFKAIVQGVNNTLDNVIGPLNVAAEYVDRIAKGDIPPKITDNYNGDFNEIKNNLNQAIDSVNALVADALMLAKAGVEGKLDTRANASKHNGDFRKIVQGVNETLDAVIGPLNVAAEYVDRIAKGDIPPKITDNYNGDFNEIKNNLNQAIDSVNALVADAVMLAKAGVAGKLATRADASKHNGDFRAIVQGVNETLDAVIGPLNVAADYVDKISKGNIPDLITKEYNGDFNAIKNNLNQCINAVDLLVADAGKLVTAAVEGHLATRADATKHNGDFRKIVEGVNQTLDAVIEPINEAGHVLEVMATGDLTARVAGDYRGDHQKLKISINSLGESLSSLINQVTDAVQSAASSAVQISSTAESLAAASQEQSAQADEVASAVEEMSRTVTENAMSATKTAEVAKENGKVASEGGKVVEQTVVKMRDIAVVVKNSANNIEKLGESSKQIGEIISVIDDIADQTNLLALNAAIEAARAGEQGRGFAVVADEVRKLAERTTEATKQIATMIKGIQNETEQAVTAMNKGTVEVQNGIDLADRAGNSLKEILTSTQEVLDMINQIAAASEEQSATSEQISKNVMSISKVTAESTHRIEDVAHTSEDLAKATEHLRDLMSQFKVTQDSLGQLSGMKHGTRAMSGNRDGRKLNAFNDNF